MEGLKRRRSNGSKLWKRNRPQGDSQPTGCPKGEAKPRQNQQLKKLVADLSLDKAMLKELVEGADRRVRRSRINVVSPARKREAVRHLEQKLEVSERRACEVTAQPRSTQRYRLRKPVADAWLCRRLRQLAAKHPRYGYRRAAAQLRREGTAVNLKRVARLWRQEGLRVPQRQHKRRRLGHSANGTQRRCATRMNEVWCYDFVFDQTEDGRRLKWLPVCDEFTRESVALEVARRMEARDVIAVLEEAVARRGAPAYIRSDNGPEFMAKAVREWIALRGFETLYIEPGSPWQNAYSETFNSRLRDELLNLESFGSLQEAKVLAKDYQHVYNEERPH